MDNSFTNYINDIRDIFKEEVQEPFYYDIKLTSKDSTPKTIFESLKSLLIAGLIILKKGDSIDLNNYTRDNENNYFDNDIEDFNIDDFTLEDIHLIKKYMLSIGIETIFETYTPFKQDYLYRKIISDIENLPDIDIKVIMNWKTNNIIGAKFGVNKNPDTMRSFLSILEKHSKTNHLLSLGFPRNLKDYSIRITKKDEELVHVIKFDFANPFDYIKNKRCSGNNPMMNGF